MNRLPGALLASLALACGPPAENVSLTPGAAYPRTLAGKGPHRFHFEARADTFLHLAVEQRGVDVVVLLRGPDGRLLHEMDTPNGRWGEEIMLAVTPAAGEHLVIVEPLAADGAGDFVLRVREARPATGRDRAAAGAAAALAKAARHRLAEDHAAAATAYREALPFLEALGDERSLAEAEARLGDALFETESYREAAAVLARAADRLAHLGGPGDAEAEARNALGTALRLLGEPARSLAAYRRALDLRRAAGDAYGEATALTNLGRVFETAGDLDEALRHHEAALAIARRLEPLGSADLESSCLQNLGTLHALIGHDREAQDLLRQAAARAAAGSEKRRTSILAAQGWVDHLAGRSEAALARFDEASALAEAAGDRRALAGLWDRRGTVLLTLGRAAEAASAYRRSLALSRSFDSRLGEANTLANLGWLEIETGAPARARRRLRRAVDLLAASGDAQAEVFARAGLCRAERLTGDLRAALREGEAAVRLVERLRGGLAGAGSRGQLVATRYDVQEELVTTLMALDRREPERGHARRALEAAERARARGLLEALEALAARAGEEAAGDDEPRRRALEREIAALEARRRALAASDPRSPRLEEIDATLRARALALDRLAAPPADASAPAITAADVQALADEDTLVVVYLLAEPESFAWTVDRESVAAHRLPGREEIEGLAHQVAEAMPKSHEVASRGTAERAARELAAAVVAPLAERVAGRRRLVILADGLLHLVPFGALPAPDPDSADPPDTTAAPLLAAHEIVHLPSAAVLLAQRRRLAGRPPPQGAAAVLADPVFALADERLAGGPGRGKAAGRQAADLDLERLQRLPYTADEAAAITRLLGPEGVLVAQGPAATRDLVLSGALRGYRIVHFATHGWLHPVLPERSGLVLSLYDERGRRREGGEGFLTAADVAALDLSADLAVLSACETGLGREVRGEGVVGLPQAFFRAGARAVVVTSWKVRDRATAELMAAFYERLAHGERPAAALRAAQLRSAAGRAGPPPSSGPGSRCTGSGGRARPSPPGPLSLTGEGGR